MTLPREPTWPRCGASIPASCPVRGDPRWRCSTGWACPAGCGCCLSWPRVVFDELHRASAGGIADYAGITYERIEAEQGVFWPCPAEDHPGTPRLFTEVFATPDGRARFIRVDHRDPAEVPDADYPYVLPTGRIMQQSQGANQPRRSRSLQLATG